MKRAILGALALLLCLTASACVRTAQEGPTYAVYYLSADVGRDAALVAEERTLPEGVAPVEGLLRLLLEGPESEELVSPLPSNLTLRGWQLEDGVVTVDFSARYAGLSGVALTLADYSVVETLCRLVDVEAVEIKAEGEYLTYRDHQRLTEEDTWSSQADEAEEKEAGD